jgi:hypothetical protein
MGSYNNFYTFSFWGMNKRHRERKRDWSWNIHGGKLLENFGTFLERIGAEG